MGKDSLQPAAEQHPLTATHTPQLAQSPQCPHQDHITTFPRARRPGEPAFTTDRREREVRLHRPRGEDTRTAGKPPPAPWLLRSPLLATEHVTPSRAGAATHSSDTQVVKELRKSTGVLYVMDRTAQDGRTEWTGQTHQGGWDVRIGTILKTTSHSKRNYFLTAVVVLM